MLFRVCVCSSLSLARMQEIRAATFWRRPLGHHYANARMVPCNTSNNIFWAKLLRKVRVTRASIYSSRGKSFCIANFGNDMFLRLFSRDKVQQLVESAFPSGWMRRANFLLPSGLALCRQPARRILFRFFLCFPVSKFAGSG